MASLASCVPLTGSGPEVKKKLKGGKSCETSGFMKEGLAYAPLAELVLLGSMSDSYH